jgi:hypothetical protein
MQRPRLTVELQIAAGLHAYGEPIPDGYVPTTLEVAPIEGPVAGALEAPPPEPFRFAGLDEQCRVYTGVVRIVLPLTVSQEMGDRVVDVLVRYQACSLTDCLPPAARRLTLPVGVLSHVERPG